MTDEQAFPGRCELCGTPKDLDENTTRPAVGPDGMRVEFYDVCPNPDCPGNDSDLAKASPDQS